MSQLFHNRYFKHKFFDCIIKSVMQKGRDGSYHLYIKHIKGERDIIGMDGCDEFMLASTLQHEKWKEQLEEWTHNNQYVYHNPFKMNAKDGYEFLEGCRIEAAKDPNIRLGQLLINNLDEETPTPNAEIYHSKNDKFVMEWFIKNYIEE